MRKFYPYIIFLIFTIVFFYKCFFFGEVMFPASQFYQMKPFSETNMFCWAESSGFQMHRQMHWNALQFDSALEFYPWRHYLGECYKSRKLPVKNEYSFSGKSFFLANGQSGFFYPLNLLYAFLPTPVAFTVFAILHVFLLQIFMYIYLKRLKLCDIGAIFGTAAFGFCSFVVNWLMLPTFVSVIVWLPLVAYSLLAFFETYKVKYAVLGGLFLALCFIAGHLQIAFYVSIFALFYFIYLLIINFKSIDYKKLSLCILIFIAVFGIISSVQIAPTLKAAKISHRHTEPGAENYEWQTKNGIHKFYLCNILNTNLYPITIGGVFDESKKHFFSDSDEIEFGIYCGFVTVFFAFISLLFIKNKNIIFYLILTLFFYYMAFGGIVYKLFY